MASPAAAVWPPLVPHPGTSGWSRRAVIWMLSLAPPGYYDDAALWHEHPAALAQVAAHHLKACLDGARGGYRVVRTELEASIPPYAVDGVLAAYRADGARLHCELRQLELVARALARESRHRTNTK